MVERNSGVPGGDPFSAACVWIRNGRARVRQQKGSDIGLRECVGGGHFIRVLLLAITLKQDAEHSVANDLRINLGRELPWNA
jgi:hypothetical protein